MRGQSLVAQGKLKIEKNKIKKIKSADDQLFSHSISHNVTHVVKPFYPRDAMLARVIAIATCLSVRPSVCLSRAGIVSKRRKLAT